MTIPYEEVVNRLKLKHGNKISILEFNNSSARGLLKCNICGHEWLAVVSRVYNKTGCPNCQHINDRLSLDYIVNFINLNNCEWIDGDYKNAKSSLLIRFQCKHTEWITWNSFQQGKRCSICGIKLRSEKHRTKEARIIEFLNSVGCEFVDFPNGIKTQKTSTVRYYCRNKHLIERKIDKIFQYQTCEKCKYSNESFISFQMKKYCEEKYGAEAEHKVCINKKTGRWLKCDIYIFCGENPEINGVYIEVHGGQHYRNNGFFFSTNEEFEDLKNRDKIKKKFARKNGTYIEIDLRKITSMESAIEYLEDNLNKILR